MPIVWTGWCSQVPTLPLPAPPSTPSSSGTGSESHDPGGEIFGGQQFTWLFSTAFLRDQRAVQETTALLASNPNPVEPEAYDRQANAYLRFDALDRLDDIHAPTLVLVGEQDLLTPPWVAREVAARIPGARLEIVTGERSSHLLPLERPDDFNRSVTRLPDRVRNVRLQHRSTTPPPRQWKRVNARRTEPLSGAEWLPDEVGPNPPRSRCIRGSSVLTYNTWAACAAAT